MTNLSKNARIALTTGEKPWEMWTKDGIKKILIATSKEDGWYSEDIFDDKMWDVYTDNAIRQYLLCKTSWHHVNGKPEWFYSLYVSPLNRTDLNELHRLSCSERSKNKCVKLMYVKQTEWHWSSNHQHQYSTKVTKLAVVYQGTAYFMDGTSAPMRDGICEAYKKCGKVVKNNRKVFDKIVKVMRSNYALAI